MLKYISTFSGTKIISLPQLSPGKTQKAQHSDRLKRKSLFQAKIKKYRPSQSVDSSQVTKIRLRRVKIYF